MDFLHNQIDNNTLSDVLCQEGQRDCSDISKRPYFAVKRLLDIMISIAALIILSVPMLLIALIIYLDDPGPVIFSQYRIGRDHRTFVLFKFRTMRASAPQYIPTNSLEYPWKHITRAGSFLRRLSLDEIPQLYNVLIGDMSLVGPRPVIPQEVLLHTMRRRWGVYSARPGITGLAQINGRDMLSDEEKVTYDIIYLENFGFLQDLKILSGTVPGVISGKDIWQTRDQK